MRVYRNLNDIDVEFTDCVITVGMFDGLHLGHMSVLNKVLEISKLNNIPSVVLSFANHPQSFFNPNAPISSLSNLEEKTERLAALGIDFLIAIPFDSFIASLSANQFTTSILIDLLHVSNIVFGYDNHFGQNREGSKSYIDSNFPNIKTHRIQESILNNEVVSSSLIKTKISLGEVSQAAVLLNYPYSIAGQIIKGDQLGRTIGFPTANMQLSNAEKLIPAFGVYLTKSFILGQEYFGMTNIGVRPTVTNSRELRIETHLFDFEMEIYGEHIKVEFLDRLRDEKKFDSFPALVDQLKKDQIHAKALLAQIHIAS